MVDDDGPEVLSCKGPCDGGTHFFLAAFGSIQCHSCMGVICPLCTESIGSKSYCLSCYSLESLLPEDNVGGTHNNEDLPAKSFTEMKKALLDAKFDGITELMPDDVEAAYTCYEIMKDSMEGLVCRVPLPLLPTSALNSNDHLEKILDIDFKEGGSFITDPSLDPHQIPQITQLLSSFVQFDEEKLTCNKWEKESPVFNVVPTMLVNIAARSHVDRGYCLLRRLVRHSMDVRTESLDNKMASLVKFGNDIGICLNSPVPASMKQDIYNTEAVLTDSSLVCCSCDCKCGAKQTDDKRNLCVHVLVVPFLLTVLLVEDLAEHFLVEITGMMPNLLAKLVEWSEAI